MTGVQDHPEPPALAAVACLWRAAGLPPEALDTLHLPGSGPVLPSSFDVATAAQASIGAAALAAAELGHLRSGHGQPGGLGASLRQRLSVDRTHAALECTAHFSIDGQVPDMWDKLSGLYACGAAVGQPGFVRLHANFAHHRDGALRLLGLPSGPATERAAVTTALGNWPAETFEQAAADAGLVVAAVRSFAQWDAHPQAHALAGQPVVSITPIGGADEAVHGRADAALHASAGGSAGGFAGGLAGGSAGGSTGGFADFPSPALAAPLRWPAAPGDARPLAGLRVLDLTRILAGPVAGRCLAAYGADVMMINGPHLPNIGAIADMSRGKLSTLIDLRDAAGRQQLAALADSAQVFLQGYRPGALAGQGFGAPALAARRPGIVVASLSAYGPLGPWAGRRGFDSLVQAATGFNLAEAQAAGSAKPQAMPMPILDYAAGHLLAFGISAALWRQATQGGSWQVQVSLAGVGLWLRSLGRVAAGVAAGQPPDIEPWLEDSVCGFGGQHAGQHGDPVSPQTRATATLRAVRHAAVFSVTPARYARLSMPPGSHPPVWPVA